VIPTIVTQALSRDVIDLGATDTTRDFLYVGDNVDGVLKAAAADHVVGEVINIGTGIEVSIGEVAERVLRLLGRDLPVIRDEQRLRPPDSEVERLVADTRKASRLLAWQPAVDLDDGLQRTIEWMTEWIDSYKPSIYNV
jgi:dTDP-glucose 4,6-dehydratase